MSNPFNDPAKMKELGQRIASNDKRLGHSLDDSLAHATNLMVAVSLVFYGEPLISEAMAALEKGIREGWAG